MHAFADASLQCYPPVCGWECSKPTAGCAEPRCELACELPECASSEGATPIVPPNADDDGEDKRTQLIVAVVSGASVSLSLAVVFYRTYKHRAVLAQPKRAEPYTANAFAGGAGGARFGVQL